MENKKYTTRTPVASAVSKGNAKNGPRKCQSGKTCPVVNSKRNTRESQIQNKRKKVDVVDVPDTSRHHYGKNGDSQWVLANFLKLQNDTFTDNFRESLNGDSEITKCILQLPREEGQKLLDLCLKQAVELLKNIQDVDRFLFVQ
jgi:hypothetical protein